MTTFKMSQNRYLINFAIPLFCLASLLYNVGALQPIGFVVLLIVISLLYIINIYNKETMIIRQDLFPIILLYLLSIYIVGLLKVISFRSIEVFVCLIISIIVLNTFATIDYSIIKTKFIKALFLFEIFILFVPYLLGVGFNPVDGGYKSIFTTTTFLGIFSCMQIELCLLIYWGLKQKVWLLFIPFFLLLVWLSMVRTAYVGVLLIITCFFLRKSKLFQSKCFLRTSKWTLYAAIAMIVIIYPRLQSYEWYDAVNGFVYLTTGKVLLSGRNEVWEEGFELISSEPLLGYGLDTSVFDMQLHNSYFELLLESGAIGVMGVFFLLNYILNKMMDSKTPMSIVFFFFTLVNLLMCTTEVMLLHGQMILQVVIWAIMGAGLNKKKNGELV